MAFLLGALLGSHLILRLLMYGIMKVRRQPNGATEIALAGVLVLVIDQGQIFARHDGLAGRRVPEVMQRAGLHRQPRSYQRTTQKGIGLKRKWSVLS